MNRLFCRAALEKAYSKSLTAWSERWHEKLDKLGESGTLLSGWQGVLYEGTKLAATHMKLKVIKKIHLKVVFKIWKYLDEHYC